MRTKTEYKGYVIISNGYNQKVYKDGILIKEMTDTIQGTINWIRKIG